MVLALLKSRLGNAPVRALLAFLVIIVSEFIERSNSIVQ